MKKIADFFVNRRFLILTVMLIITVICGVLATTVEINKDRTLYLADSSNMKQGLSVMGSEFPEAEEKSSIRVMFEGLSEEEVAGVKAKLEALTGVSSVTYDPNSESYNKDGHTLFVVNSRYDYKSDEELAIEEALSKDFSAYKMVYKNNDIPSTEVPIWLLASAVVLAVIVLIIMSPTWLDPFLFLLTLTIALAINFGTNVILPYTDEMTATVGPILQLVLSMDYSIILITRYRQEKLTHGNNIDAMKTALAGSITSIASSSLTTAVGLLALVFLSFKLGPELGIVLSKGVFISMICVLTVLPTVILAADKWLEKTRKKSLHIPLGKLAKISFGTRRVMPVIFVVLLVASFILQGYTTITFSEDGDDPVAAVFHKENTAVVIYDNKDEAHVEGVIAELEKDEKISSILGYSNTLGLEMSTEEMSVAISSLGSDIALDTDLIRMLYFMAEDSTLPTLTASEFMSFISEKVLQNETFSGYIDDSIRENIGNLEKFADKEKLTTPMTSEEIAEFFGFENEQAEQLYLFYNIQNGVEDSGEMSLSTFVNFILNTVAKDETYGAMFDEETLSSLEELQFYTDKNVVQAKYGSSTLSSILGVGETLVKTVFFVNGNVDKMSIEEFINFVASSNIVSGLIDQETSSKITLAQSVINATVNGTRFTSSELSDLLGMDAEQAEQLYILYMSKNGADWKLSPRDFVAFAVSDVLGNESFADMIDEKYASDLKLGYTIIEAIVSEKSYSSSEMSSLLASMTDEAPQSYVDLLYIFYGATTDAVADIKLTMPELFSLICDELLLDERFSEFFDEDTKNVILSSKAQLNDAILQLRGDKYARLVITSSYPYESPETGDYITRLNELCEENFREYYLIGNSVMVHEMDETFDKEYLMISFITAIAIFFVVLFAFKNPTMPLLLTLVVQCGVFITTTIIGAYSGSIYYLALLIVQSILMGATIDYGIVFCNFYNESRQRMSVIDALRAAYEGSCHTIMTSGSILVLVLAALGLYATSEMISEVCVTLSIGVFIALVLILFVLPGMVACFDKLSSRQVVVASRNIYNTGAGHDETSSSSEEEIPASDVSRNKRNLESTTISTTNVTEKTVNVTSRSLPYSFSLEIERNDTSDDSDIGNVEVQIDKREGENGAPSVTKITLTYDDITGCKFVLKNK